LLDWTVWRLNGHGGMGVPHPSLMRVVQAAFETTRQHGDETC
jgi:hypothetical protein